ncbi:MAG: PIN domain-containing protein [Chthoniobacterales bacterium]
MAFTILDSHALLTLLRSEAGSDIVRALLEKAAEKDIPLHMTEVNYAEVQTIVRRKAGNALWKTIADELTAAPIQFHPVDRKLADLAADFKTRFRLSLADACAAALAKEKKGQLVTGDPEFQALEKEIGITWLK